MIITFMFEYRMSFYLHVFVFLGKYVVVKYRVVSSLLFKEVPVKMLVHL